VSQHAGASEAPTAVEVPLIIATVARERGITGVHTHVRQLRLLHACTCGSAELVTPHRWAQNARRRGLLRRPSGADGSRGT
jgi:hypothetical protein